MRQAIDADINQTVASRDINSDASMASHRAAYFALG
jgi:hypothetical protein